MFYSVASRFQGAITGILIAQSWLNTNKENINQHNSYPSAYLAWVIAGIKSIINQQDFDLESWQLNLANTPGFGQKKQRYSYSELAIATLPISLFYYGDYPQLKQNLVTINQLWHHQDLDSAKILIWAYVIQIILANQFQPHHVIDQILLHVRIKEASVLDLLKQINGFIQEKIPLTTVSDYLQRNHHRNFGAIAQSLYCLATIGNNFRLGVKRAQQTKYQPQLTTILTAILCGMYQSYDNFSLRDRYELKQSLLGREIEQLSHDFFAVWSGCYFSQTMFETTLCEAPGKIQRRNNT
jgi:hypothetical protein